MLGATFFSIPEIAKALGISRITAYRHAAAGTIPSVKIGARRLVPASYLQSLEAKAQAAASPNKATGEK